MFHPDLSNNEYNNEISEKQRILGPLTESELASLPDSREALYESGRKVLLERNFEDGDYKVIYDKIHQTQQLTFHLSSKRGIGILEFVGDMNGTWGIPHRKVDARGLGISGSDLLQQAESFLKILKDKNLIDLKRIYCGAGQKVVIEWLLKNGYSFSKPEAEKQYNDVDKYIEDKWGDEPYMYEKVIADNGDAIAGNELRFILEKNF